MTNVRRARLCGFREAPSPVAGCDDHARGQDDPGPLDGELPGRIRYTLAVADRDGYDLGHPQVALDDRDGVRDLCLGLDRGIQLPWGGQDRAGLPESGQDLADVAQEQGVGSDHQHATARDLVAVRVQQIGRSVQADHGLAASRAALDDEDPGHGRPDDPVLLGLDGGHDVAHATRASGGQCSHERAVALVGGVRAHGIEVQHVVLDPADRPAVQQDVPPPGDAHRGRGGRAVERLGGGRAPVSQQEVLGLIGQAEPSDVDRRARGGEVEPAEAEPPLRGDQGSHPLGVDPDHGLTLDLRGWSPSRGGTLGPVQVPRSLGGELVETVVHRRDHGLLGAHGARGLVRRGHRNILVTPGAGRRSDAGVHPLQPAP